MKSTTLRISAVALAAAFAGSAFATDVKITGNSNGSKDINYSVPSLSDDTNAGQFEGLLDGKSFLTYCTDLAQGFKVGTLYTDYNILDGDLQWSATKANQLGKLLTYVGIGVPVSAVDSAVNQAAIWEILSETDGTFDFKTGTAKFSSDNGATQTALNDFKWGAAMGTTQKYFVDALVSKDHQDFLVTTPVPEPGTYALMIAGLAAVGFVARRRRAQA